MKQGQQENFWKAVVARSGRPLLKFFVSRLPRPADAPDLVQEVYLRILRVGRPDLIRSPEAYLFTIAANLVREHSLKHLRRPAHIALDDTPEEELPSDVDVSTNSNSTPEASAEQQERIRLLERTLLQLSPRARAALVWHRRDGCTYNEIGGRLGVSSNMVKKYLAQALAHCHRCAEQDAEK
jgi:RNA polymerase sigma factor (sigma-70 family)